MATADGKDPQRYTRLPTAPVPVGVESGPQLDGGIEPEEMELDRDGAAVAHEEWHPTDGTEAPVPAPAEPRLAPWALLSAIVALFAALFVGWGIPVAIVSVIAAIMSLRRPEENRVIAVWALVLGCVATLYSAGWLLWAAYRFGWFG
ncbi:hypothetical protein LXM50_17605 [Microbacterium sp. Au-Mic1]|uniref:hypothetical protein n=1 Tax=Microbacterium sp. Au-Mic1 TaxID=2906457 RepID=UPI001E431E20|nr:hypothetical protein [Microbacterium sp. Au-Mic1]MCE4027795.1 hypothetical protein [Microbacterium sp. Au-Mic1]